MAAPSTPTLSLSTVSSTSFQASITGDAGVTHRLFYRNLLTSVSTTGGTRVGNGTILTGSLTDSNQYLVWVVSDNGEFSLPTFGFISLVVTDTLHAAIKSKWFLTPTLLTKAGKLYANEVPERDTDGTPLSIPYTYLDISRTRYEWTTVNTFYEYTDLEFNTFCVGAAAAEDAQEELKQAFSWKTLPFTSSDSVTISVSPIDDLLTSENIRDKNGSLIYKSQTCYQVCVQRQLLNQPDDEV